MHKRGKMKLVSYMSCTQIFILIMASFAFSFIINQADLVSAQITSPSQLTGGSGVTTNLQLIETTGGSASTLSSADALLGSAPLSTTNVAASGSWISRMFGNLKLSGGTASTLEEAKLPFLQKPLGIGAVPSHLLQGAVYAAIAYFGGRMVGDFLGLSDNNSKTLGTSLAAGVGAYKAIQILGSGKLGFGSGTFGSGTFFGSHTFLTAGIISIAIFIALYKDEKTKTVTFQCFPWEPPLGGSKCDECNKDSLRPCSEYRCKSLGQACDLVNKGQADEQCVWINRGDVTSPTITPNQTALSSGLVYQPLLGRPIERGVKIVNPSDSKGCLQAFTKLKFGLDTNELAQCRLDYAENNFTALQFLVGGSNSFTRVHEQEMRLPSPNDDRADAPIFKNDGTMSLFVRCQDANGNTNEDIYLVEFCVNKGPDTTAPAIESTSIVSGSAVQYQIDQVPIRVYTNEPAQCKWSRQDKAYDNMENTFTCASSAEEINAELLYECSGNLTAIKDRENNNFFFRCRDSDGNTNSESKPFSLRGSQPLTILNVEPNGTLYGSTNTVVVNLGVTTDDGSDEGKALCMYNGTFTSGFVSMFETNAFSHKQTIDLPSGNYVYNYRCMDAGGNIAVADTVFSVRVDKEAPKVTRTYHDLDALKIVTDEDAVCTYSLQNCNFNVDEGLSTEYPNVNVKSVHAVAWDEKNTYHIKCVDSFGNQPEPSTCSAVLSPRSFAS